MTTLTSPFENIAPPLTAMLSLNVQLSKWLLELFEYIAPPLLFAILFTNLQFTMESLSDSEYIAPALPK